MFGVEKSIGVRPDRTFCRMDEVQTWASLIHNKVRITVGAPYFPCVRKLSLHQESYWSGAILVFGFFPAHQIFVVAVVGFATIDSRPAAGFNNSSAQVAQQSKTRDSAFQLLERQQRD